MIDKVNEVISALSFMDDINENQRLKENLGFDSLSLTTLLVELEEMFMIEFMIEDISPEKFNTVGDVYALISKYAESCHAV